MALATRRKLFDIFVRECAPTAADLAADFGVSGHDDHPVHYFFESLYPWTDRLTAIGREAEGAGWLAARFPGLSFLQADLRHIPVEDGHFDVGLCNAVVEHAGSREQQADLVREVCRVCKCVLFTTPNKGFPVEMHTFLPFVQWLPDPAFRGALRRLKFDYFADVANLNPLYGRELLSLFPRERENRVISVGLGVLRTNLVCVSRLPR